MLHLLLIDDDPLVVPEQVRRAFPQSTHRVTVASHGAEGLEIVRRDPPSVVLLDLHLPDQSGLEVYERIREIDARIPVIFVTMAKTADTAIEAMKQGAFNYLHKPLDLEQLRTTVAEAFEVADRMQSPVTLAEEAPDSSSTAGLFGSCRAMLEIYKSIGRVAAQDVTVLVTGESAVPRPQLRGDPGESPRERALRSREGRLHGRGPKARRQVRTVPRRNDLPRRDRRHATPSAGQDPAAPPRADVRTGRRQRDDPHRRTHHRRDAS
jgi:ActR/RegA family two-component response regulator